MRVGQRPPTRPDLARHTVYEVAAAMRGHCSRFRTRSLEQPCYREYRIDARRQAGQTTAGARVDKRGPARGGRRGGVASVARGTVTRSSCRYSGASRHKTAVQNSISELTAQRRC